MADHQVGRFFAATDEFKARQAETTDTQSAEVLHQQAVGRSGDAQGAAHWRGHLATSMGREDVAVEFYTAEEGRVFREKLAADGLHLFGVG